MSPPERNTRTVIENAWWSGIPCVDEGGVDVLERARRSTIAWTATTRAASWRSRRGREAADEVLGEHGQALLGLVVAGQPAGEHVERLVRRR